MNSSVKKIAIVMPNKNIVVQAMRDGFISELGFLNIDFDYNLIIGDNNEESIALETHQQLKHTKYDLILSIGKMCTETVKHFSEKNSLITPIVFCGVLDPVGAGIISSYQHPKNNLTGIAAELRNYDQQIQFLLKLKSDLKNVVLVTDSLSALHEELHQATKIFKQYAVNTIHVKITKHEDFINCLKPHLENTDLVMIFRDHFILSTIHILIGLCNTYQVPLFTSDAESVKSGAAFSFSGSEYDVGVQVAHQSKVILTSSSCPSIAPVDWKGSLLLNIDAMRQQKLSFTLPFEEIISLENTILI